MRCRKPAYWQTYSVMKATEGGPGQRWAVRELKAAGFKHVQPIPSCYVGQTAVRVLASTARHRRASRVLYGLLLLLCFMLPPRAAAQQFWTKPRKVQFTVLAASMAYDGYTTQRLLTAPVTGWERNPLARPFVKLGWGGQALASGAGLAATFGTSYWLSKHGHPRLAYVAPFLLTAASTYLGHRNTRRY